VYAQSLIDSDEKLSRSLSVQYAIKQPHVAVFTEVAIPKTRITRASDSYVFHGILDYAIGFIPGREVREFNLGMLYSTIKSLTASLSRGNLNLDISNAVGGVIEAKGLLEMKHAMPQITMQVVTTLKIT
jgi:hypothetical protein